MLTLTLTPSKPSLCLSSLIEYLTKSIDVNTYFQKLTIPKKKPICHLLRDGVIVEGWPQLEIIELSPANLVSLSLTCDTQMASSQPAPPTSQKGTQHSTMYI